MHKTKTLILERGQIEKCVDIKVAIKAVEDAFLQYGKHKVQMPAKIYLNLPRYKGDFRAMPAYIESKDACTLKWVNAHPQNASKGFPAVMGVVILSDPKTGFPLSIMDGTYLTDLRTGAAGAVAAKYLAREDSSVVALVGCGSQAKTQLLGLKNLFNIKEVRVWGHKPELIKKFIKEMKNAKLNLLSSKDIRECVKEADIVVTTTPSRKPIVKYEWLSKGTHINAIGADAEGKQELDPVILKKAKLVVDDWAQASHSGEINVALSKGVISKRDIYSSLGAILAGAKKGRVTKNEITVFDSTGLAIQDTALAAQIYKKARSLKIGRWAKII